MINNTLQYSESLVRISYKSINNQNGTHQYLRLSSLLPSTSGFDLKLFLTEANKYIRVRKRVGQFLRIMDLSLLYLLDFRRELNPSHFLSSVNVTNEFAIGSKK